MKKKKNSKKSKKGWEYCWKIKSQISGNVGWRLNVRCRSNKPWICICHFCAQQATDFDYNIIWKGCNVRLQSVWVQIPEYEMTKERSLEYLNWNSQNDTDLLFLLQWENECTYWPHLNFQKILFILDISESYFSNRDRLDWSTSLNTAVCFIL
jgi:hypothetical protein